MTGKRWIVGAAVLAAFVLGSEFAGAMEFDTGGPLSVGATLPQQLVTMPSGGTGGDTLTYDGVQTSNLGTFDIVINAGPTLAANPPAVAAFNRAAAQWEAYISDPITVTIAADMADLGSGGIIGQASSVILGASYDTIRDAMVADAGDEADDAIVASLPTAAQFSALMPTGASLDGDLTGTKANLKALGFGGLDTTFGVTDATITFNTQFSFDYDNSDGVTPGTMDFETVAAHEIGHGLGFVSIVDTIDYYVDQGLLPKDNISPRTLDLFRFDDDGANDPSTAAEFTTMARSLVPGNVEITDQIDPWSTSGVEILMSTGVTQGDGRQASHWKDSLGLGLMDPTLSLGETVPVHMNDLRAMDLIGYEIVPEPATLSVLVMGGMALLRRRRQA